MIRIGIFRNFSCPSDRIGVEVNLLKEQSLLQLRAYNNSPSSSQTVRGVLEVAVPRGCPVVQSSSRPSLVHGVKTNKPRLEGQGLYAIQVCSSFSLDDPKVSFESNLIVQDQL